MSDGRNPADGVFATTRWTLVARARGESPEARMALSDLCAAYYGPVEAFIRRQSTDVQEARDLTQEFFARLLAGSGVGGATPERGRFRSYLLGAVKHFLHAEWVRRSAAKRGAGAEHLRLESEGTTEPGLQVADSGAVPADVAFHREWAHALLDRALTRLGVEMAAEGKARHFEVLKGCLQGAAAVRPQAELGEALGMSEATVKVAIHRLRKRFREVVRAEIAETLADGEQVEEEMRHLIQALS
jgi:RNA polymerase sigma-70 factor (ECF subfamily)